MSIGDQIAARERKAAASMTRIENQIYKALVTDPEDGSAVETVQQLYRKAYASSPKVYQRIDWASLNQSIRNHFGNEVFRTIQRHAVR